MATLAPALVQLRAEYDAAHPGRSKRSDGWIGDTAHQARKSDHNPDITGIVWAIDLTATLTQGDTLTEYLRTSRDPRIKYVIWNRRIFAGPKGPRPWEWRPYTGSNPHMAHVHISARGPLTDSHPWGYHQEDHLTADQAAQLRKALDHAAAADLRSEDCRQRLDRIERQLSKLLDTLGR